MYGRYWKCFLKRYLYIYVCLCIRMIHITSPSRYIWAPIWLYSSRDASCTAPNSTVTFLTDPIQLTQDEGSSCVRIKSQYPTRITSRGTLLLFLLHKWQDGHFSNTWDHPTKALTGFSDPSPQAHQPPYFFFDFLAASYSALSCRKKCHQFGALQLLCGVIRWYTCILHTWDRN